MSMNKLDIVRTSITSIINQGGPAYVEDMCMYRTPDGKKCAAGIFIPDDVYASKMEGEPWALVVRKYPIDINFGEEGNYIVSKLQMSHDTAARNDTWSWSLWKRILRENFQHDGEVLDLINELLPDVPS